MGSMWLDEEGDNTYPMDSASALEWDPTALSDIDEFQVRLWGDDYRSLLVLLDFADTDWKTHVTIPWPLRPGSPEMIEQLRELVTLQREVRLARMGEIMAQAHNLQTYILGQLGISRRVHPTTYKMLKMASRIGELIMVQLKNRWPTSVRPSQIYPLLFPPTAIPGHPSYPSGHALISHFMALTIMDIVPALKDKPTELARRIGFNREIAGLHFAHDTRHGIEAAHLVFPIFKARPFYEENLADAQREWNAMPTAVPALAVAGRADRASWISINLVNTVGKPLRVEVTDNYAQASDLGIDVPLGIGGTKPVQVRCRPNQQNVDVGSIGWAALTDDGEPLNSESTQMPVTANLDVEIKRL
jgi:hypothetical protein